MDTFDFIIIGAGAAGSTLANRLSELNDATVLILEAGGHDLPEAVEVPWRWNELLLTSLDWAYNSVPQPSLNNRRIYSAAGKGLGGGSSVYHMMHVRARPADLDGWVKSGAEGWSFQDCLPYFQKLENQAEETNPTRGVGGPITVINARETGNPVSQAFIEAGMELGYPYTEDFNATHFGVGWHHVDIKEGKRGGVLTSYLLPALARHNVTLKTEALTTKLLLENHRCIGVEYVLDGQSRTAYAEREVIVCAGAIESPKLLLLSGIGDFGQLKRVGIQANMDLPGVGENFHDHPLVIGPFGRMNRAGPDPRGNMTEVGLFCGSVPGLSVPDLEICLVHRAPYGDQFFTNIVKRMQTGEPIQPVQQLVDPRVILSLSGLAQPLSRGWVRLSSSDPTAAPAINANYGAEASDLERLVQAVKIARTMYRTRAFAAWGLEEIGPGPSITSESDLWEWVRNNTSSYYHFVGTCRMGLDGMAVVDPELKVHGVDGLRVADGSIMPTIPSGNPHTTIVMIAERAAAFIKKESASGGDSTQPLVQ